jgi:predicted small lipoprotein YifL
VAEQVVPHRSSRRTSFVLFIAIVFSVLAGCGTGGSAQPLVMNPAATVAPVDASGLRTHEDALRGMAAIFATQFGLPVPAEIVVRVYPTRAAFERGLVQDAHVAPARAAELAEFAIGVGKRRLLLFNDEDTGRGREWLRLIAHELTHVSQIELAQGEGRGEQWLAEGMAEWIAFRVLERLHLDTMVHRRAVATAGIRNHAALVGARLDLATLGTPRGFTIRHLREGSLPTYQLAFLMADYLIERDGLPDVIRYFRLFSEGAGRQSAFEQAFGQTLDQFEQEVLAHLKTMVSIR